MEQVAETGTITVTTVLAYTAGMIGYPSWAEQGSANAKPAKHVAVTRATTRSVSTLMALNRVRLSPRGKVGRTDRY